MVMLYDGAISFLERALAAFEYDDPLEFNSTISNNILRAQSIVTELSSSLDFERGGDIATTLRRLYDYMDRRLTESNLRKSREGILEVVKHLTVLRDAWREIVSGNRNLDVSPARILAAA